MATSGSIDFNQTRNQIVNDALALIGVYGVGRTISSDDMNFCTNMLNKMVKAWQAQGIHLWGLSEGYLFVADNTASYTLSSDSSSARATTRTDAVITQLNGAHAAAATSLTVDSTTGMSASDIIGIVNDDDVVTWTTISNVGSSTTLTIAAGLTGACADNNNVYTFTARINKPLRIQSMRRVTGVGTSTTTATSIPLTSLSQDEYFNLTNKFLNGTPTSYYYQPGLTTGTLYLWPRPDDPAIYFELSFERMLEDFDASTNNPDFPSEWLETITYQLAYRIAPAFGKDKNMVEPEASAMLANMISWDQEITSITLSPDK